MIEEEDRLTAADALRAIYHFQPRDQTRGRAYFRQARVCRLERILDDGMILYTASVQGSSSTPYTSFVLFDHRSRLLVSAECTCPLEGDCKHCVATLDALATRLAGPRAHGGRPDAPGRTPPEAALDRPTAAWLDSLAYAAHLPDPPPSTAATSQLVFLVSEAGATYQVGVFRANLEAGVIRGSPRIVNHYEIDWARDPAVSAGDHALVVRMAPFSLGYATLMGIDGGRLFADLVATGRARFGAAGVEVPLVPGGARRGSLSFVDVAAGVQRPAVVVTPESSDAETTPAAVRVLGLSPPYYVDMETGLTGPIDVPGVSAAFAASWLRGGDVRPAAAVAVGRRLSSLGLKGACALPRVRTLRHVRAHPKLVARLESSLAAPSAEGGAAPSIDRPWVRVFYDYDGMLVEPGSPDGDQVVVGDEIVSISRSPAEESRLIDALVRDGLVPGHRAFSGRRPPPGTTFAAPKGSPFMLAPRVTALASDELRVERASDFAYDPLVVDDVEFGLSDLPESAPGAQTEFALSLGLRVGDETIDALPVVLAALREKVPEGEESLLVTLADGRTVLVSAARLRPLRQMLIELLGARDPGKIPRVRAVALDPAVLSRSPASLAKLKSSLTSPRRAAVPKALRATLREYQRAGFCWLVARREAHLGAVLADDMGLGKTVQTLALLLAEKRGGVPSLVVCPKSVLGNWEAEAARFAPTLRIHVHQGVDRATRVDRIADADVVLTSYPLLARDAELLAQQRFATVVLDEAQTIKTASSSFTHAACALRADFRLALSGTPMENNLGELWSVMRFALPELLGDSRAFGRAFRRPIERDGADAPRRDLVSRLAPFMLRRRKEAVASELPPKTISVERVVLEDAQRDVYETVRAAMDKRVRDALVERGLAKSHIIVLDALLKLRQAVCDPRLLQLASAKRAGSAKLVSLVEKLVELVAEGRRVLVFSQFVTMLELVEIELRKKKIAFLLLTGQTENRAELVEKFQRGDAPVFLLSLKAGGTGLNLTAADVVIHYDPWWNPAAEAQATDRAHRIGQDKSVLVYKLVGKDTIEEKILLLQQKKQALFASVMDEGAGVAKKLTADDVAFLFAR